MRVAILLTACAGLALGSVSVLAQDAAPASGADNAAATSTETVPATGDVPVSVEIALGSLSEDGKLSAAANEAETATNARIVLVSELQTGPTNATVEQLRELAMEKSEALEMLREKLSSNSELSSLVEEHGGIDRVLSAALDDDGNLLIFVDDEQQM